MDFIAYFQYQI